MQYENMEIIEFIKYELWNVYIIQNKKLSF